MEMATVNAETIKVTMFGQKLIEFNGSSKHHIPIDNRNIRYM